MKKSYLKSSLLLVLFGICLGNLARLILGAPDDGQEFPREFSRPLPENFQPADENESLDVQLSQNLSGGYDLVPPIISSSHLTSIWNPGASPDLTPFDHDELAIFEPHGNEVCASGCALSRHPTGTLAANRFNELLEQFSQQPIDTASKPLEELLYFGPQTQTLLDRQGSDVLDTQHAELLRRELTRTHAKISIRVIEQDGTKRCWLPPTRVPFDRRHVFEMKTESLQPLVTSGTIKRVGLNHIWARL